MIKNISIENFRQFKKLDIDDFGVMNIFVGDNNVGKTSVLEAIGVGMNAGGSDFWLNILLARGMKPPSFNDYSLFTALFNDFKYKNYISINIKSNFENTRILIKPFESINKYNELKATHPNIPFIDLLLNKENIFLGLEIEYLIDEKKYFETFSLTSKGFPFLITNINSFKKYANFIQAARISSVEETVALINQLTIKKEKTIFIDYIQKVFPMIKDLIPLNMEIHVDMDGYNQLMPSELLGGGTNKAILIFTTIFATEKNNAVLIDEIDGGLHFGAMIDLCKGINKLSELRPFQLFCTTHSAEMLEAAVEAFSAPEDQNKLRIYRLERHGEETIAKKFDYKLAKDSLEFGSELRGVHRRG